MNIAILLAAGTGSRLGTETPKQFLKVLGKTVIEYTLDKFEQHPQIDEMAVVVSEQYRSEMEAIVQNAGYKKVKKILNGGAARYDSCWAAIEAYNHEPDANLLIHDAVRPMVDIQTITDVIAALNKYNAVTVAVPATDTIYQTENNLIQQIPDRKNLMRAQTPQAFKQHTIQKAYLMAFQNKDFTATDDCGFVVKYLPDEPVFVVPGSENNLKITHIQDFFLFENLFRNGTTF